MNQAYIDGTLCAAILGLVFIIVRLEIRCARQSRALRDWQREQHRINNTLKRDVAALKEFNPGEIH